MNNIDFKSTHAVTKILFIALIVLIFYFAVYSLLKPFYISQPTNMMQMMSQSFGSSGSNATINLFSMILAVFIGIIVSFYIFKHEKPLPQKLSHEQEYEIIKKALSDDEKAILSEISKAGEITQDSLKYRLNWSKAKISTILTNLDKMNLIQRERTGKTYKVYLQKNKK